MITRQCANCVDLATQLQIKSGECEGADALHEAEKQMHERTTEDLRIVRANNAQMCKDMDRMIEQRDELAAQNETLRSALDDVDSDWDGEKFHNYEFISVMKAALALPDLSTSILKQRDAALIERCAKLCNDRNDDEDYIYADECYECAEAIRAMGETK